MATPVILFLSTGRCGTQWLAATLGELCPRVDVTHEPVGAHYAPRRHFRGYGDPLAPLCDPIVAGHVERVERCSRTYVETGWPLFGALPLFAQRLGDRLRVVHLTRHPVPTALSHATHNSFAGSNRDDPYTRLATLGPTDPHVFQPHYVARWAALTPYERCLFWWTEVNLFGLEFAARLPHVPLLRISSERMLAGDPVTLSRLATFIGATWDERWIARANRVVDRWQHRTDAGFDPGLISRHPLTMAVAGALGYDLAAVDLAALRDRYAGAPSAWL